MISAMNMFLFQKDERQQHQKTYPKQNDNGGDVKGKVLQLEKPMRIVIQLEVNLRITGFWDVEF